MKISFRSQQYRKHDRVGGVSVKGTFRGKGIDFLAVTAKLYGMPYLWFSEGLLIELDFNLQVLTLKMPSGEIRNSEDVVCNVSFSELINLPKSEFRKKYIYPFAADAAEFNFGMKKTARAIREMSSPSKISRLALREGHPVLDGEIDNLLFREQWEIETSYARNAN